MTPNYETKTTAELLLLDQDKAKRAILDHIAALRTQRSEIDAELERLGARRIRKPRAEAKKRGRPVGSRNIAGKAANSAMQAMADGALMDGLTHTRNAALEITGMGDHD